MNFDALIGKETEVKNKAELKSWFEDDKLYVGEYVKHKINQLDEPEVLSQDWINKFTSPVDDEGRLYVWKSDLQNLLVPKQELPVIPQFVAKFLDGKEEYALYELLDSDFIYDNHDKLARWLYDNGRKTNREREFNLVLAHLYGYEVEEEPLYHAKIKGWEILGSGVKWVYLENSKELIIGDMTFPDDETEAMTKEEWNELGINDTNADFEVVSE